MFWTLHALSNIFSLSKNIFKSEILIILFHLFTRIPQNQVIKVSQLLDLTSSVFFLYIEHCVRFCHRGFTTEVRVLYNNPEQQ